MAQFCPAKSARIIHEALAAAVPAGAASAFCSLGRIGAIQGPIVGGWIIKMQVAPFAVLTMLVIPVAMCAVGVLMFRNTFQTSFEN